MGLITGQSLAAGVSGDLIALLAVEGIDAFGGGVDGQPYSVLKKGTAHYAETMAYVTDREDGPWIVEALHIVHGEKDTGDGVSASTYAGYLNEWQSDYDTDIKAETLQTEDVLAVVSQVNSWPEYPVSGPTVGLGQLAESISNPNVIMAGPKYQLGYSPDEIHMSAAGYERLAIMHVRAHLAGPSWTPLQPASATIDGTTITVQFDVPVTPLQFDTTTVAAQTNQGFTVVSDSGAETISGVALGVDGTSVEITLSGTPGANPKVRYGFASQYGNLCDSETDDSLANWCVHFEQAVT